MSHADLGGGGDAYYVYDAGGQRVRKWVDTGANLIKERIYLGGFEIYREHESGSVRLERQTLHVMDGIRRIAMVETKTVDTSGPFTVTPRIRFQLDNHLGSAMLEVTETGEIIGYEEYHPYGTSAYRSAASGVEVSARRYRYTGKERDEESGLYYYGARYYACWLGRWTSADPSGIGADGPGLYSYTRGSPVRLVDPDGRQGAEPKALLVIPFDTGEPQVGVPTTYFFALQDDDPLVERWVSQRQFEEWRAGVGAELRQETAASSLGLLQQEGLAKATAESQPVPDQTIEQFAAGELPEGFFKATLDEVWEKDVSNSDNPLWSRVALGGLSLGLVPLAYIEEIGRGLMNAPGQLSGGVSDFGSAFGKENPDEGAALAIRGTGKALTALSAILGLKAAARIVSGTSGQGTVPAATPASSKTQGSFTAGRNFKEHFISHKNLLEKALGTKYTKLKDHSPVFLDDLGRLVDEGKLVYAGRATIIKGDAPVDVYRGMGLTLLARGNEFVTLLKSGEGRDLGLQMVK